MSRTVILKSEELDDCLTADDRASLEEMSVLYGKAMESFPGMGMGASGRAMDGLVDVFDDMGKLMQDIAGRESRIHVYSFDPPWSNHGEVSRLIAKLRDTRTGHDEFVYYIQRGYELLFNLVWVGAGSGNKNHLLVETPVSQPVQNYAIHKIPFIDDGVRDTVMCVMLRGALLPSMIVSKEIQEYSSDGLVTPFALFRIQRKEEEGGNSYVLDLEKSYFDPEILDGRDLVFADPMNATGGSLVTIVKYLLDEGVRPGSIRTLNVISALQGALQMIRRFDFIDLYTLWMDPVLNDLAYILPGLGDAGDRINGVDGENPRNMVSLIADYGTNIASLYRDQVREIERTVLG